MILDIVQNNETLKMSEAEKLFLIKFKWNSLQRNQVFGEDGLVTVTVIAKETEQ